MWKEYVIEPACLVQSAETFRSIRALFGTEQGRWVAKFPGRWKELVKAVLRESQLREIERTRVVEWLSQDRGRFVGLYGNLSYQESLSWLDNALAHHRARPFAGLIASSLGGHDSAAIVPNEGEDISSHLPSPHQITVARTPQAISAAAIPLLRRSQAILFVDPNCGFEERFMAVLREMLRVVDARPQRPLRIEYHFRHDPERALDTSRIGHGLPAGADIVLFAWREREGDEGMHDRFILGEDYGLEFSYGLDRGELGQTTGVTRMAKDRHAKFWRAYQRTTAAFDLATGFPVTVSRA